MPNIKSAKKRVLVTETKTLHNKMLKSELKTLIKKFDAAVESGDKAAATEAYKVAVKKIDKAVGKSIIAKNTSNRKKSKLTVKLNKMGA
ncbi:MAG: 30S ribosomal protein S20 [Clostridia bacterium]|nr:30S ribosomal protein S20 [Clostridia bacterium]